MSRKTNDLDTEIKKNILLQLLPMLIKENSIEQLYEESTKRKENKANGLMSLIESLSSENQSSEKTNSKYKKLIEIYKNYKKNDQFKPGDCIKWKRNMKNSKVPAYDEPILFLRYIPSLKINEDNPGQSGFLEEHDMLCGVIIEDQFTTFGFDSSRFALFELSDLEAD